MATFILVVASLRAETLEFSSGEEKVSLLELFTSEGCSSCPPAEAWLATLSSQPGLWKSFVPVAFHVDYWNRLGWRDRFSSPVFTDRQNAHAAKWGTTTIYTPEFVLDGKEWRRGGGLGKSRERPGVLRLRVEDREVTVSFHPAEPPSGPLAATIAPLARGVVTDVRAGENANRRLAHDFVALALVTAPLERVGEAYEARFTLPEKMAAPMGALAAWVHLRSDPAPIQAVGAESTVGRE